MAEEEISANGNQEPDKSPCVTEASFTPVRHGAFTQREIFFQQQEANGAFSFVYLLNDGQGDHSLW